MIEISLPNIAEFRASMQEHADQIPFATSRALNEVTKLAQLAMRNRTGQVFDVRRKGWVDASVKITHFSSKYEGELYTSIGIHPPGGDERADILGKFETESVVLPHAGAHVVVPLGPNAGKILRQGQRFSDYHFVKKGNRWEGDRNAFMIPISAGRLLVLQRVAKRSRYKRNGKTVNVRPHDAMPLFVLVPQVHITPNLEFEKTVRAVVEQAWPIVAPQMIDMALASAR
jgi:hypothetical protein